MRMQRNVRIFVAYKLLDIDNNVVGQGNAIMTLSNTKPADIDLTVIDRILVENANANGIAATTKAFLTSMTVLSRGLTWHAK